ncbi:MAG: hypothetical protein ACPGRE_05545 [Flavobacteriaceae bacterium]
MFRSQSTSSLSEITVYMKYARYLENENRRENWEEICYRNSQMHQEKYPQLKDEIKSLYSDFVLPKKILPSMRSMQFAGKAISKNQTRIYNCAYMPLTSVSCFSEGFYLLLGGTGVGYSVQQHHVDELGYLSSERNCSKGRILSIEDTIEGWSEAVRLLIDSYYSNEAKPEFDFSLIRPEGQILKTAGGRAPGPRPLKNLLEKIEQLFDKKSPGSKLSAMEASDLMCYIADAVLAGGIRRAAMICLFSPYDQELVEAKQGSWYEDHPERARANFSAVLLREELNKEDLERILNYTDKNQSGEPGVYLTNNLDWGTNPCCEIALKPFQFCNLTEINMTTVTNQKDFEQRAMAASFLGTLQAGYTDFEYLREIWSENCKTDALLGVSMTGIAQKVVLQLDFQSAAELVKEENRRVAQIIGINGAKRCTTVKPAGTTSLVLGSSSGIHAWHSNYYIRRIRIHKKEALATYLLSKIPSLMEEDQFDANSWVLSMPQKAPQDAITRDEGALNLLKRVAFIQENWVKNGYVEGDNQHNVSCTVSYKPEEWKEVKRWMWNHQSQYNGLALLPYNGGSYAQAPFESITELEYKDLQKELSHIDLNEIQTFEIQRNFVDHIACAGGQCEI